MSISQFKATTADLITSITSRGLVPTNQNTYTVAQMLQIADEELQTGLLPLVLSTQEEYYSTYIDYATPALVMGLPDRAIGGKLRAVCYTSQGKEWPVPRIELDDVQYTTQPSYYFRGNDIVFTEQPPYPIRMYYHTRPSHLIQTSECGRIAAIDSVLKTFTLSAVPSTYTTALTYDVVSSSAPAKVKSLDQVVTSIVGTAVSFSVLPTAGVGDYFCLSGQSPCIQLPYELIPVLAQRVAVKVLEGIGDMDGSKRAQEKLNEMEPRAFRLLEPRSDSQPHKVINRNSGIRTHGRNQTSY